MIKCFQTWVKINEERKSLLCLLVSSLLVMVMILMIYLPMFQEARGYKEQRLYLEKKLVDYESFANEMGKDYEKITASQNSKLIILTQRLPNYLDHAALMEEIYSAAKKYNVNLTSLKEIKRGELGKNVISLQMQCKGNYKNVLTFIETLEEDGCFKSLEEFGVHGDELSGNIQASTMIVAYKK